MSIERIPPKKIPHQEYQQLFSRKTDIGEVEKYVPFDGNVKQNISELERVLSDEKSSPLIAAFRSYDLLKFSLNEQIEIEFDRDYKLKDAAFNASQLAIDIAIACYQSDSKRALALLSEYKEVVNASGSKDSRLRKMLNYRVHEKPDLAFLPSRLEEEDFQIAEKMFGQTNGKPILMIGVGWRGAWRFPEIFSEYEYLSETYDTPDKKGSLLQIVRFSAHYQDYSHLKYPIRNQKYTRENVDGRTLVLVGASEKLPRLESYLRRVIFTPDELRSIEVLRFPLKLNGN